LEELTPKKMKPQLLVGHHAQVTLAPSDENRRVGDGVGGEMLKLDPIMMEERPHEVTWGRSKPVAMELDEANHVALRRVCLLVFHRRRNPFEPSRRSYRAEEPLTHQVTQPMLRHHRWAPFVSGYQPHRHGGSG